MTTRLNHVEPSTSQRVFKVRSLKLFPLPQFPYSVAIG
ncbi:uncharacterized protein METZ01_LOCUS178427, partial [marine metagenome]